MKESINSFLKSPSSYGGIRDTLKYWTLNISNKASVPGGIELRNNSSPINSTSSRLTPSSSSTNMSSIKIEPSIGTSVLPPNCLPYSSLCVNAATAGSLGFPNGLKFKDKPSIVISVSYVPSNWSSISLFEILSRTPLKDTSLTVPVLKKAL